MLAASLACKGEKKKETPPAAEPTAAPSAWSPLTDDENAWLLLVEAGRGLGEPGDEGMVAYELRRGNQPDPAKLAAAEKALASYAPALERVARGVARGKCQVPDVPLVDVLPAVMSVKQLASVKLFRATLAGRDGDLEDAARDLAGVVDLVDLLARCGGGLLLVSVAQASEADALESAAWLAGQDLPAASRRHLLDALAVEPGDPMAIALDSEARIMARAADELAARGREGLVDVMVLSAQVIRLEGAALGFADKALSFDADAEKAGEALQQQVAGLGQVDDAVRAQLTWLLARHRQPLDPAATRALVAAGLQRVAQANRRGQPDEASGREVKVILSGLAAELGPAVRLLTDPESVRGGIPPDIERAFLACKNPLGRLQAGLALRSMSNMVTAHRERSAHLAAERARVVTLLSGQGGAAK